MIQENEIRVGNKIKGTATGLTITVDLHFFNECYDDDTMLDWYTGIVLSPDILEKCGFEDMHEKSYGMVDMADKNHCIYRTKDGIIFHPFCTNDKSLYIKIKYLHQLQNLIFAITGEELNVKLKN